MDPNGIKALLSEGIFFALFIGLYLESRKDSKERECKYIETINKLADKIEPIQEIKEEVQAIKEDVKEVKHHLKMDKRG